MQPQLRLTENRRRLMLHLHRSGGDAVDSTGRLRLRLAHIMGHGNSTIAVRRTLADLDQAGLISCEASGNGLYRVALTPDGLGFMRERGLISAEPRRYIFDEAHIDSPEDLGSLIISAAKNLQRGADALDFSETPEELRLLLNYALHADLTPALPEPVRFASLAARFKSALSDVVDSYLADPDSLTAADLDRVMHLLIDLRVMVVAARFEIEHPLPELPPTNDGAPSLISSRRSAE